MRSSNPPAQQLRSDKQADIPHKDYEVLGMAKQRGLSTPTRCLNPEQAADQFKPSLNFKNQQDQSKTLKTAHDKVNGRFE